jgi:hypothetical protein
MQVRFKASPRKISHASLDQYVIKPKDNGLHISGGHHVVSYLKKMQFKKLHILRDISELRIKQ